MANSSVQSLLSPEWIRKQLRIDQTSELRRKLDRFETACDYYDIRTKDERIVQFRYDTWFAEQQRLNRERTGCDLVLKARQIGLTTQELLRGYHLSTTRKAFNTQVVGHDEDLVEKVLAIVHFAHHGMENRGLAEPASRRSARTLEFSNSGSQISIDEAGATQPVAVKKGRSVTINRLHCTEIAFWRQPETTMKGLRGACTPNADILIESTANGAAGYFHHLVTEAQAGRGEFKLHFFPWWQHAEYRINGADIDPTPRDEFEEMLVEYGCDAEQLAWWRKTVEAFGLDGALQEYPINIETCFRTSGNNYLEPSVVDRCAKFVRAPLRVGRFCGYDVRIYEEARRGLADYIIGADTAEGVGNDASTCTVLDRRSGDVVAVGWSDRIAPGDFGLALAELAKHYNNALLVPERNNHGAATLRAIEAEAHYYRVYEFSDKRKGWLTNMASRPPLWEDLRMAVVEGSAVTPDAQTLNEMRTLIIDKDGRPRAAGKHEAHGSRDDLWVSWAIAWQVRGRPADVQPVHVVKGGVTGSLRGYY
jgi:hypothetical protein